MPTETVKDQRYLDVEDAIFGAFDILTRDEDPEKITVSEIIKKAGIVRSTFYKHYEDMPALINAVQEHILRDISTIIRSTPLDSRDEVAGSYFLAICRYAKNNMYMRRLFRSPSANQFIEKALTMFHVYAHDTLLAVNDPKMGHEKTAYAIAYSIGGVVGVLHRWSVEDCADSPETVAAIVTEIFLGGMRPYLS